MKFEKELADIRFAINEYEKIAPDQFALTAFMKEKLAIEEAKGVKLSYLRRVHKELLVCARETFPKSKLTAFKLALANSTFGNGSKDVSLEKVVARGSIKSSDEYQQIMIILNEMLQGGKALGDAENNLILKVNDLLLLFEKESKGGLKDQMQY